MTLADEHRLHVIQLFEPDVDTAYTIEAAAHIAQVSRRSILVYYKHGLVSPVDDLEWDGYYFNDEAIRTLRHIEYLRTECGVSLALIWWIGAFTVFFGIMLIALAFRMRRWNALGWA